MASVSGPLIKVPRWNHITNKDRCRDGLEPTC
jgi:hypothetical protein